MSFFMSWKIHVCPEKSTIFCCNISQIIFFFILVEVLAHYMSIYYAYNTPQKLDR